MPKTHSTRSRREAAPKPLTKIPHSNDKEVQKSFERFVQMRRSDFASNLDVARQMYRKHKAMVTAPDMPAIFRDALLKELHCPPGNIGLDDEVLAPDFFKKTMAWAEEVVAERRGREAQSQPTGIPTWLTETPHECEYLLIMEEGGLDCQQCQDIQLTREEYLKLKVFLAKLRGITVPSEKPEGFTTSNAIANSIWSELEPREIAAVPEVARA